MSKFIEVLGDDGTWHFINQHQITKVSCKVDQITRDGGYDIRNLMDSTIPPTLQTHIATSVAIRILTANGEGDVHFDSESEADMWAHTNLGIDDFIARSQTIDR